MSDRLEDFRIPGAMMRYSLFVPRLYNLCLSLGFAPGRIMPSRAFCSDENQGYPVILIAKHFGIFPFNHGRVGGIVSTGRHGPHAHHGRDLVIIQASHVGYDPESGRFGAYRRLRVDDEPFTPSCGKIGAVLQWYREEFAFARNHVSLARLDGRPVVIVDNRFVGEDREEGLFLRLELLVDTAKAEGLPDPIRVFSTARAYPAHSDLVEALPASAWPDAGRIPIGDRLTAPMFEFRRRSRGEAGEHDQLVRNLHRSMTQIITSAHPALAAAQANTLFEFDRTYRSILLEPAYQGRNLLFISGVNIDISRNRGQLFPLTKFAPWAAYVQTRDGKSRVLEQEALLAELNAQREDNPHEVALDGAIEAMKQMPEVMISSGPSSPAGP